MEAYDHTPQVKRVVGDRRMNTCEMKVKKGIFRVKLRMYEKALWEAPTKELYIKTYLEKIKKKKALWGDNVNLRRHGLLNENS